MNQFPYHNLAAQIEKYDSFSEWILLDVKWEHQGTTLVIVVQDWKPDDSSESVESSVVSVRFALVQEFRLVNGLTEAMLEDTSVVNWGLSEIDVIRINKADNITSRYVGLRKTFYHAALLFSGERRIDVVFHDMIIESTHTMTHNPCPMPPPEEKR